MEERERRINEAYEYTKKVVRNNYEQEFDKRWEGRFSYKIKKDFFQLFEDEIWNVYTNDEGDPTEEESFEKVMKYLYASGLTSFMIMLQDYIADYCFRKRVPGKKYFL